MKETIKETFFASLDTGMVYKLYVCPTTLEDRYLTTYIINLPIFLYFSLSMYLSTICVDALTLDEEKNYMYRCLKHK